MERRLIQALSRIALCALAAALFAPQADAADLIKRFFGTQSETKVADVWFGETLPNTLREACKTTPLPMTKLWFSGAEEVCPVVEIQSVKADNKTLVVRAMLRKDENGDGKPEYRADPVDRDAKLDNWRPRYLVDCYDVTKNEDGPAVAFAAWLYAREDSFEKGLNARLARRVLAVVYKRNDAARADIEAYIIEREKLKNTKAGDFVIGKELDQYNEKQREPDPKDPKKLVDVVVQYAVERETLMTKTAQANAANQLEKEAEAKLLEISDSLGDFGKPAANRKKLPKKYLVLIKHDLKQYRELYKDTKYFATELKTVERMEKSIDDDWAAIATARANYDAARTQDKKAEALEPVLKLDPHDIRAARDCAMAWVAFANIEPDGNKCQNETTGVDRAIPVFERILKLRPGNTSYMYNLARCYQVKRDDEAKRLYNEVIRLEGKTGENGKHAFQMLENMREK